jgi:site-specific recombinase XerD
MASMALKKGMNVAYLSKIMAHSNLAATMIYAKLNDESLDREMEILNS